MIVVELQYFPPITFISTLFRESYVYLDLYESYRKMSFRNRCMIAGAQGIISLSVPLKNGRSQLLPVNEVRISETEHWQNHHYKSICSAYNRSPFFEYYADELEALYVKPVSGLVEWNLGCLDWLKKTGLAGRNPVHGTVCTLWNQRMGRSTESVVPRNYSQWNPVKYRQVFEERGWVSNLSVIDLLFNAGKQAAELLRAADLY
jgi:hypothetical protein